MLEKILEIPPSLLITIGMAVFNVSLRIYDYKKGSKKPQLVIDRDSENSMRVNPTIFHLSAQDGQRTLKIPYVSSRVPIKNIGEIAAQDCYGYINFDGHSERVSWVIPRHCDAITIHPDSVQELDFCAKLTSDLYSFNHFNNTDYNENEIQNLYARLGLPETISPTENGFAPNAIDNRRVPRTHCEMIITSITPNTKQLRVPVNII